MKSKYVENEELFELLSSLADKKNRFADIYISNTNNTSISIEDNKVESVNEGFDNGLGLRLIDFDNIAYAYTNNFDKETLDSIAHEVKDILGGSNNPSKIEPILYKNIRSEKKIDPIKVNIKEKIEILQECNNAARSAGSEIKQVSIFYLDQQKKIHLLTSEGIEIEQDRSYIRLIVQVIAAKNGIVQMAFDAPGFQGGFEVLPKMSPKTIGKQVALRAIKMLDASPAPSGQMPVIIERGSGGVVFHEAIGHGLEADEVSKHSAYKNKLGEKVATRQVTLIDDPTLKNLWGSYAYDDEGTAAQKTVLIENGKLVNYLCDKINGKKIGHTSTGNSRRESYAYPPIPRMSNTFLQPGEISKEEIIKATKHGLYAKKLGGGQVDPQSGDFVFSVAEGYFIKNGKIDKPIKGATLVGNGPQFLFNIDMVANDLDYEPGTCGKDGQGASVTTGQPTIRVSKLTVGGTEVI